jgi:tRNA threonylcarbamoyl adenosine modification protein YeaZ
MPAAFNSNALYLALETSGPVGSVAVAAGARVLARALLDSQVRCAADLIPRIGATLDKAGVGPGDLAGVVVGGGPGSFTGVRVAAATGKGIAHALDLPMWAFSSLEAGAVAERVPSQAPHTDCFRYVLFDARGDRVYAACYRVGVDAVEERVAPHATRIGALLASEVIPMAAFVGDGAARHEDLLRMEGYHVLPPPAGVPTSDGLLHLLALRPGSVPVSRADRWEPEYVKGSSAELGRSG